MNELRKSSGITLLLSLFIISTTLAISLGFINIIIGGLRIVGDEAASTKAIFAAKTGMECAYYAQFRERAFQTNIPTPNTIECDGNSFTVGADDSCPDPGTTDPQGKCAGKNVFAFLLDNGSCVEVLVERNILPLRTHIESKGWNKSTGVVLDPATGYITCNADTNDISIVERLIEDTY